MKQSLINYFYDFWKSLESSNEKENVKLLQFAGVSLSVKHETTIASRKRSVYALLTF